MESKRCCLCPPSKRCKHLRDTHCKDVTEIKQALNYDIQEALRREKAMAEKPPRFKTKAFRPCVRERCVPMHPSMHTRLRYITHCPPSLQIAGTPSRKKLDINLPMESDTSLRRRPGSPFGSMCTLNLPKAAHYILHTSASNKSIIQVPSPKDSGEVIRAERAFTKPGEWRPPLPAKSGHDLHQPHSGIYINQDKYFIPEHDLGPGTSKMQRPPKRKRKLPCYKKGGICKFRKNKKKCPRSCRKNAEKMRRQRARLNCLQGRPGSRSRSAGTKRFARGENDEELCGDMPKMEHVHRPTNLKKGALETHSLTVLKCIKDKQTPIHYGILTGTCNMYNNKFSGKSRGKQALTMSAMAYCLAFHYHPKQWTMKLIDNLLDAGDAWYLQCLDKVHDHSSIQGVCEVLPFGKKQILLLNKKKMKILLGEPDIVGYTMSLDPTVYNLCRGLKAFFIENRAGIFMSRVLKVVIWKDRVCYYIFDPAGRDSRAYSNYTNGCAALINVKDLEAVAEVVLSRSILNDQKFVIAPLKILKMLDEQADEDIQSDPEPTNTEKAMMSYRLLNENSAIVNANMHLGDRSFEDAKHRQALPIAVAALSYAKISPPNTWYSKTLDKIIRLGNKLFHDCLPRRQMIDLTIDNIPNEVSLGHYCCDIIIYREKTKGQLFTPQECLFNIKTGLKDFFDRNFNSGILEFKNYSVAIWKQKEMYYLFDPYPRTADGLRAMVGGKACCWMLLNTDTMAEQVAKLYDFMPETTPFVIHAFKVLKLRKKRPKKMIVCTLSEEVIPPTKKTKRKELKQAKLTGDYGDSVELYHNILPMENYDDKQIGLFSSQREGKFPDEEMMGDIVSLVDSIQEELVPPIPMRYKNLMDQGRGERVVNLDSPTVSVTQVVPPWPKPRDKTNEPEEPDPEPEPTPPPTPPPPPPPEGEEEEMGEEALMELEARKRAEEEEERRKAEELPPPLPTPPPTPQFEDDEKPMKSAAAAAVMPKEPEEEIPCQPVDVNRKILLSQDAQHRFRLRQVRKKMSQPLDELQKLPITESPSEEYINPSNFKTLPDDSQIIRGKAGVDGDKPEDILPFVSIVAIVISYKFMIHTWTQGIVSFVVETGETLFKNKKEKFQLAPVHLIPKIGIGKQVYHACIDVVTECPTWQLENTLCEKFFNKYDRGMITTATYSCAVFKRNNLYYLFDASPCNAMGFKEVKGAKSKGSACFMRFRNCKDLVARINYNRDGKDEQQAILSRIMVRRLQKDPRLQLPEDYDYKTMRPKDAKSKTAIADSVKKGAVVEEKPGEDTKDLVGYQQYGVDYRINGTTSVAGAKTKVDGPIKACHFVSLVAMLMASMHPLSTWTPQMVDSCVEKGLEICDKTGCFDVCEKRVIRNLLIDGKIININIKKILVVNENQKKSFEQFIKAVLRRLRYVIVRFPKRSVVVCDSEGFFHLFDPYPSVPDAPKKPVDPKKGKKTPPPTPAAAWTIYKDIRELCCKINLLMGADAAKPEFYTFELTSMKNAPKFASYYYKLSPLFQPEVNPNLPYLKRRRVRPPVDEKMYWLNIETIPWTRMNPNNDLGFPRKTPKTMWKNWDIEFPGDLYSLWGSLGPTDKVFEEGRRGKQVLACNVVALVMTQVIELNAWTSALLDGIVKAGDKYHVRCAKKIGTTPNFELVPEELDTAFDEMDPYTFTVKFNKVIFGFVYNMLPDRFNLSNALSFFFETNKIGLLVSPPKNLAFGQIGQSYFMYDCHTAGSPLFCPGRTGSYILKCESLNRLIYVMTIALNIKRHGQQFHLYSVDVNVSEKAK